MKIEQLIAQLQKIRHEHYLSTGSGTGEAPKELDVLISRTNLLNQYSGYITHIDYVNGKVVIS